MWPQNGYYVFEEVINGYSGRVLYRQQTVEAVFLPLLKRLTLMQKQKNGRLIVFLAAPPATGKSTLVEFLKLLSEQTEGLTALQCAGMDGFHLPQSYLSSHTILKDNRELSMLSIKGAPETFDLPKLSLAIKAASKGESCPWPVYNRQKHDPEEGKLFITSSILLLEGNYLLLDEAGWRDLKPLADYSIFIRAEASLLRERLVRRKLTGGKTLAEAEKFVAGSDIPNALRCLEHSLKADLTLQMTEDGDYRE